LRYRVKLEIFEGPFDLLLFLIRKNEVDIYDIPISKITEQFLDYLSVMEILDLNIAGDFVEMVAILMNIKAKMLLPKTPGLEEEEDPRSELVKRLIEYKKFKDAAQELEVNETKRAKLFSRKDFSYIETTETIDDEAYLKNVTLFNLMMAFKKALDNMPKITYHEVKKIDVTVERQADYILNMLEKNDIFLFQDFFEQFKEKIVLIVTFIAMLDLAKANRIMIKQSGVFDDIRIKAVGTNESK
jgi:segregation and condensation protein A